MCCSSLSPLLSLIRVMWLSLQRDVLGSTSIQSDDVPLCKGAYLVGWYSTPSLGLVLACASTPAAAKAEQHAAARAMAASGTFATASSALHFYRLSQSTAALQVGISCVQLVCGGGHVVRGSSLRTCSLFIPLVMPPLSTDESSTVTPRPPTHPTQCSVFRCGANKALWCGAVLCGAVQC